MLYKVHMHKQNSRVINIWVTYYSWSNLTARKENAGWNLIEALMPPVCVFFFFSRMKRRGFVTRYLLRQRCSWISPLSSLTDIHEFRDILRRQRDELDGIGKRDWLPIRRLFSVNNRIKNKRSRNLASVFLSFVFLTFADGIPRVGIAIVQQHFIWIVLIFFVFCAIRASASQAMMMEPMRLCRQRRVRQHLERTNFNDNGRHERIKSRQVEICRKEPKVLQEIVKGAQLGTKECQHQFRNRRWNCTTARKSLRKVIARGTTC